MVTVKNLMNSPDDLAAIGGTVRIPALGTIDAEFTPEYLSALRGIGYYEITDGPAPISPLDHDGNGNKGGVADPSPLTAAEEVELLEAMTDDELRDFVERKTGTRPHPNAKSETLLKKAKEAAGAAD